MDFDDKNIDQANDGVPGAAGTSGYPGVDLDEKYKYLPESKL